MVVGFIRIFLLTTNYILTITMTASFINNCPIHICMKVIVNVSEDDIAKINELVSTGKISSIPEFISTSIQNQLSFEGGHSEIPTLESIIDQKLEQVNTAKHTTIPTETKPTQPSDIKSLETVSPNQIDQDFPFWGTQNKYLCLKQITTDFAKLVSHEKEPWIRYDLAINFLYDGATDARRKFEVIDKLLHRPRGEKFVSGFPLKEIKSLSRYERQFIGGMDGNNRLYGMALYLGLLGVRRNEDTKRLEYGITKGGLKFSNLQSPVFNKKTSDITPTTPSLSGEEAEFIINLLRKRMPSEIDLMTFTLHYIDEGKNHPEDGRQTTKEYLDKHYPDVARSKKEGSFTIQEADTIRTGVVSRLKELGLITIHRLGNKSEYHLTDFGYEFLGRK